MIESNTVVLTIHNKEKTISQIVSGILSTVSKQTSTLVCVLDGCTDKTEAVLKDTIRSLNTDISIQYVYTDDVWETLANNAGLRKVETPYATIIQDDMLIREKFWDRKLLSVFKNRNIFAVSGRTAHDFLIKEGRIEFINLIGREYPLGSTSLISKLVTKFINFFQTFWIYRYISPFGVRLTANRGPLVLDMKVVKDLNYFDEAFAPFELDDVDLCCRAKKRFGLSASAYPIDYLEIGGSKATSLISSETSASAIKKNTTLIIERHADLVS